MRAESPRGGDADAIPIHDAADPRLADYVDLPDTARRHRVERARGFFIVEGYLAIEALAASAYEVRSVLVNRRALERLRPALTSCPAPVYLVDDEVMRRTVGFDMHRGAVASATRPASDAQIDALTSVASDARRVLVLEGVNDHENLGALFRNAAAFGVDAVLLDPTCADPLYRRSVRVSLGHVLRVPFVRAAIDEALPALHEAGWTTVALSPRGERTIDDLAPVVAGERVALVLGAEGPGLTEATMRAAQVRARIDLASGVDSLNVATAAAIALHVVRPPGVQRQVPRLR